MLEKEQLRKKIKQLKYKIEKEESFNNELTIKVRLLRQLQREELGIERILKKIRFKLNQKGMNINDWINSLPYEIDFSLGDLVQIGDKLGLQLDRQQKNLFINFMGSELSSTSSSQQFRQTCVRYGFKVE